MQIEPVPLGGANETGKMDSNKAGAEWRSLLQRYAHSVWQGRPAEDDLQLSLTSKLGALADDALQIVEAYARGARGQALIVASPAKFAARLELILNGIESALAASPGMDFDSADAPPHMIQSELWQLLRKVRESADLAYAREQYLIELDRRILFLLQDRGPKVPADVSSAVGVDKAQVSRSVKRLLELGLIEREQIRAPLHLTRDGQRLAKRLMRMAELRNRELTMDVSDEELSAFYDTIEQLLDQAIALYDEERRLAGGGAATRQSVSVAQNDGEGRLVESVEIDRSRVIAPLMTLSAYFSRSGSLAFKRLTGLSRFEAFVLSEIGIDPPVDWNTLVSSLSRDHSQAGRTVTSLVERGLVVREGQPGRRHGRFRPSAEGARLHRVIHEAGRERSEFLLAPLAGEQRARFLTTFDKIRRNASAQLERERAFAEIYRP